MIALAIDTSGSVAGLALATEDKLINEISFAHKMDMLRRLVPSIDKLFSDVRMSRADLDGVIISLGPGSFTGLRIGMAAAKSLAHVLGKPIVGIPTLDVLAHGAVSACPKSIVAAIHARPGDIFWALYRCESEGLVKAVDDNASTIEEMFTIIRSLDPRSSNLDPVLFCGDGAERNREAIEAEFGAESIMQEEYNSPKPAILAALGLKRLTIGDYDDTFKIEPRYVRKPTPVIRNEERGMRNAG